MSTNTPNYQLLKPDPTENVNVVSQINDNYDTIDTELKRVDDVAAADGVWTAYTPVWASVSNPQPVIGNGTLLARYARVKKLIYIKLRLVMGSTTTFGTGDYSFTLPLGASASHPGLETFGQCTALDAGTAYKFDVCAIGSGAAIVKMIGSGGAFYGPTVPHTWANTDFLNLALTYETA